MGLDISSKSSLVYHFGYGGLHYIRFMAYRFCGGTKDFSGYSAMHGYSGPSAYDWCFVVACQQFPNLMFHSDAEGTYTKRGRANPLDGRLLTGSSTGLLRELERMEEFSKTFDLCRTDSYEALLALVRDVVKNHDGRLTLC